MQTVGLEGIWFHLWKISVACACGWALHSRPDPGSSAGRALGCTAGPQELNQDRASCSSGRLWEAGAPLTPTPLLEAPPPPPSVLRPVPPTWAAKWRDTGSPASSVSPEAPGRARLAESRELAPLRPQAGCPRRQRAVSTAWPAQVCQRVPGHSGSLRPVRPVLGPPHLFALNSSPALPPWPAISGFSPPGSEPCSWAGPFSSPTPHIHNLG